ncbi:MULTISPECIES: flagellar protein export ATPase FliI [unclassified Halomonas]|uniref:flagellar protein export ATPase FliI n=1 Tax=unclassified Halomonas TaxID=2609666 RepID=UPI002887F3B2|nr:MULTISPECIES: flagellar protein export ATPase FliI [unclassified Halomonas]MDT0500502.1 flagellar protein export ATPase FliI [Halomonas sp. PAR7]MDT0511602.1 flagellar protein export ATPase FliI [Halomonas sp. LES1]MDT0590110.1 flagellar protein export ATPase FliI [Halomonas sp. PAR8]
MSAGQATNPYQARWQQALRGVRQRVAPLPIYRSSGRVVRATGLVIEVVGLQVALGNACRIELPSLPGEPARFAEAEVVGFAGDRLYLMPLAEISGLSPGARVLPLVEGNPNAARRFPIGESLLGRVVDGNGSPLDGLGPLQEAQRAPLASPPLNPLSRAPINEQIDVGIRAINALLSVGRGQRMGLFAGSGVGKSVLLGMMARYTRADIIVVGLIGERGREVQDFIDNILGKEGLARSVVVAAPADTSPLQRLQGAAYATRLAEGFRDQGHNVLLIMDSLTRFAMAQREIALAIGEPPATKGYPPSVFAKLPGLVERAGNAEPGGGSITAFYTVLTEGDDQQDPIADSARAILDGHIVLSRTLAEAGHYPAIDIEASISRVMTAVADNQQQRLAQRFKGMFSRYQRNRDLISVGAYHPGNDPQLDEAVQRFPQLETFLQQRIDEIADIAASQQALISTVGGPA